MAGKKSPFIIVMGASAGGLNAINDVVSQLPGDINASVFIVLHLSKAAVSDRLVARVQKNTSLICKIAEDHERIKTGHVYVAPPDAHLLIKGNKMILGHGPAENRFRPSIDVLFRSAAASKDGKVIGIVLSGLLNDGTAGMDAIKKSGGTCIVQDPNEAEYPDMPLAVLGNIAVDYSEPLKKVGVAIRNVIDTARPKPTAIPFNIIEESKLSERSATSINEVSKLGRKTIYSCPDCGGGLWEIQNGKIKHYRCHIGHSYSEKDLLIKQSEGVEATLWVAIRMMEERKILLRKMAEEYKNRGTAQLGSNYAARANELDDHIQELKNLLFAINRD